MQVVDRGDRSGRSHACEHRRDQPLGADADALQRRSGGEESPTCRPCARARTGPDGGRQHAVLERQGRGDRQEHREAAPLAIDLKPKVAAAGAVAQMATQIPAPQRAAAHGRELLADVATIGLSGDPAGEQRLAGLEHERLHLLSRDAEHRSDLFVTEGVHLGQHQRGALIVRQLAEVGD
jgi:hypothetical protein